MGLSRKPLKLPRHELALLPLLLLELKAATSRTVRTIHIYNRRKSADPAPASEQPPAPLHLCGQKIIASHRIALQNKIASHCQYGLGKLTKSTECAARQRVYCQRAVGINFKPSRC